MEAIASDQNFYSQSRLSQSLRTDRHGNIDISGTSNHSEGDQKTERATTNNSPDGTGLPGLINDEAADPVDSPDNFYKGFQDASDTNGENTHDGITNSRPVSSMRNSANLSLRSDSNGTTAKYPVITGSHTAPNQSYRSVSAPMNDGHTKPTPTLIGVPKNQQPSVRDLLKRFDHGEQQSSLPRRTPPKPQSNTTNVSNRYNSSPSIEKRQSAIKPGYATRERHSGTAKVSPARATQRSRFAIEDQRSNNTLSSAPRPSRPKNGSKEIADGPQTITNLSISVAHSNPVLADAGRKPLFGEIIPTEYGSQIAYGISDSRNRGRRTSDSNLLLQTWSHRQSSSDIDISPSSPTAWYLGATPKLDIIEADITQKSRKAHNRSQSDLVGFAASKGFVDLDEVALLKSNEKSNEKVNEKTHPKAASRSRLPVRSRPASVSSASSSPTTRSSSPFAAKMNASAKKDRKGDSRPWSPSGHGGNNSRLSAHGYTRSPGKPSTSNASLKAYISSPPPMKSPPLRSSRPRLPVSVATTASSRSKISESSSRAHLSYIDRAESGVQERARINMLASAGPVDYAAKRARIQQAFSKTIQETELKDNDQVRPQEIIAQYEDSTQNLEFTAPHTSHIKEPKLVIDTSFQAPSVTLLKDNVDNKTIDSDSPTLGMPNGFPGEQPRNDEIPASPVSAVTLFDNELQTEPAQYHSTSVSPQNNLHPQLQSSQRDSSVSPEDFFDAYDGGESIQIVLDDASNEETQFPIFVEEQREAVNDGNEPQLQHPTFIDNSLQSCDQETESTSFVRATSPHSAFEPRPIISDVHFGDTTTLAETGHFTSLDIVSGASDSNDAKQHGVGLPLRPESWSSPHGSSAHSSLGLSELQASRYGSPKLFNRPFDMERQPATAIDYGTPGGMSETRLFNQQSSGWADTAAEVGDESSQYISITPTSAMLQEPSAPPPPPPPPKEEISPVKPDIPPKPTGYGGLSARSPNGDTISGHGSEFYSSVTDLTEINYAIKSPRNKSTIPPIPAAPSWIVGPPSPPPVPRQADTIPPAVRRRTPPPSSVWNRHPPPSLHRYSFKDPESRRVSGDEMYSYRPSTSTARSSAQISLDGDAAETSLSSTDHLSLDVPQQSDENLVPGANAESLRHRKMLIQELIDTEAVYLKDMNVVVEIYQGTAEACPKLGNGDIKTIFRNSEEVIAFSERFLADIKSASAAVYIPRSNKSKQAQAAKAAESIDDEDTEQPMSLADDESDWAKDQKTTVGENFGRHIKEMERVYADFLKNSEVATNRLQSLQADPTVNVWLEECNAVAKDLSGAWDLDALLVKPVQRITRYQLLLTGILKHTPQHHPDCTTLQESLDGVKALLDNIDGQKKRIHKVNEIVTGRKRKESDIRSGLKNPFTRRDKAETAVLHDRANEDQIYLKYCDKFHSEWIHLQFIIRDIDLYLENVTRWVDDFLRYLSAIELVVRASPSGYPELESKWARFNLSMRDVGKVALEEHKSAICNHVLDPFSDLIKAYIPPQAALKKRNKRRPDFQKFQYLKNQNRKIDEKLAEQVEQYTALNDTLKLELPKLSALNENIKNICLARLITIQFRWYSIWNEKLKAVLEQNEIPKDINDILDKFSRDFKHQDAKAQSMGILNGTMVTTARGRLSQSTTRDDELSLKTKSRASTLNNRSRGLSTQSDSHIVSSTPDPSQKNNGQPNAPPTSNSTSFSVTSGGRPEARLSLDSSEIPRPSAESANSGYISLVESGYSPARWVDGLPPSEPSFSDVFNSALPWSNSNDDSRDDDNRRLSQAHSDHVEYPRANCRVLYVVASLHEFNIEATKTEAGYPYLTYEDGEIFDVVAEKGELWLAKNQDDPKETIGWIWNQHFARMVEF